MASPDVSDQRRPPSFCEGAKLEETPFFREFKRTFEEELLYELRVDESNLHLLHLRMKLCLLYFAVFPENAEISRRLLRLWWIGEDIAPNDQNKANEFTDKAFQRFVELGIIEPVKKESRPHGEAKSFKMSPLIRAALIKIAKDAKVFDFNEEGNPPTTFSGKFKKACLGKLEKGSHRLSSEYLRKLETLFNVSEPYPDLRISEDSFARMKNLGVLYLGRWESTARQHIEVESSKFLKPFQEMKKLKFLSLQGISKITKLASFGPKLSKLIILDLRACYSLEQLPTRWDYLKSLSYLDISECYLLEFMPKSLGSLPSLKVFKGFVLSDKDKSCSLLDLKNGSMKDTLEKLSLVINRKDSMVEDSGLKDLGHFQKLRKLKITWVPKLLSSQEHKGGGRNSASGKNLQLDKLDLECYPLPELPKWMQPKIKLYIRGGFLKNLELEGNAGKSWSVKILRFKYLRDFKMNWRQIKELFPKLTSLERIKCPGITFCPCDGNGFGSNQDSEMKIESSGSIVEIEELIPFS